MGEAAAASGNSESIIRKHYLDLKSTAEAEQFFGICHSVPRRRRFVTPFVAALVSMVRCRRSRPRELTGDQRLEMTPHPI